MALSSVLPGTHDAASLSPSSDIQPYISGGTLSNNGRLKYVVEIIKAMKVGDLLKEHLGEGALLTTDWVLTTAAAAPDLSWAESLLKHVLVVVGRADGSDGVDVGIDDKKSVVEPNNKILKLLKLKEPVVLGALIKPANLPSFATDSTGLGAILAGWGKDRKELKAVDVKVFSKEQCTADGVTVADDEICTSAEGNACKGDDGAPLANVVVDYHVVLRY